MLFYYFLKPAKKANRYDNDHQFSQARDTEEDHKFITRRDDKKREVENDEKWLTEIESVFLRKENFAPAC